MFFTLKQVVTVVRAILDRPVLAEDNPELVILLPPPSLGITSVTITPGIHPRAFPVLGKSPVNRVATPPAPTSYGKIKRA